MKKVFGLLLVFLQFFSIGILLFRFRLEEVSLFSGIVILLGFFVGMWAVLVMRKSKLRVLPDPSENAVLVIEGPYKIIRHPMYSAILLFCAGINQWRVFEEYLIYLLLLITLLVKLTFEEHMLKEKFKIYQQYQDRSYRIIPFLF